VKISSLIPGVRLKLGNRSDVDDQITIWLAEAIRNLSVNFPFTELQVIGNTTTFNPTGAVQTRYPVSYFMNSTNDDLAFIDTWWYWFSGISGAGQVLKYRNPAAIMSLMQLGSISGGNPTYWTRFGNQVMVAMPPSAAFNTFWLYQRKHPFPEFGNVGAVADSTIMLPDEWADVIKTVAAIKGAPDVEMVEKIPTWQKLLYGDPKTTGNPGFIKALTSQYERDSARNERQISFVVE
jgi:hypothetical protein